MKFLPLFSTLLFLTSCTKKIAEPVKNNSSPTINSPIASICFLSDSSKLSYDIVKNIFLKNCLPCHSAPGSGNINLDTYQSCADLAKSGQLIPVITETDPNNIMMPPPPQKHLDSCEIKALNLWLKQACPLN